MKSKSFFGKFDMFGKDWDNLFSSPLFEMKSFESTTNYPNYNVFTQNGKTILQIAVTGFAKENISVSTENDILIIKTEMHKNAKELLDDREFLHKGLTYQSFTKKFSMFSSAKIEKVELLNGVLIVILTEDKSIAKTIKTFEIQ